MLRVRGADEPTEELAGLRGHVVVVGHGVAGRLVTAVLRGADVPYVVLDLDTDRMRAARERGEPTCYGDTMSLETMNHLHLA